MSASRVRSIPLIVLGASLLTVAVLIALFPFVPILFSDAKFLSENVVITAASASPAAQTIPQAATSTTVSLLATSQPPTLPEATQEPKADSRLFIKKIGVSVPIVEGKDAGALLYGAWRYPGTSRPHKGSNTVIFGHRFRYLPPNNTTFYHLNKLAIGDAFGVQWLGKTYNYKVTETKIIQPNDFSVVQPTEKPRITLITCAPLFSTKERLVVVGELVSLVLSER